ncbi:MAG TPA: helix-turn-helix transcriptional regulator [Gemmatimonadaceae bacterium]|nr:helix-turn-helix transcriptional regulator [Gemmatimonadaceae bacterium]
MLPPVAPEGESGGVASVSDTVQLAAPRLSALGKRIEMLRLDRGLSKQHLARSAGTSRQQLWRVMTGKSELTGTLCARLASVLDVDSRTLSSAALGGAPMPNAAPLRWGESLPAPLSLAAYLGSEALVERTLHSLPAGDDGVALKCALLNAIEERARLARLAIPGWLFRLRGAVLNGSH